MKPRNRYLILFSCLMVVLSLMEERSYAQSLTAITESDIHVMLNAMDRAARKRNLPGMIAPFAEDIKLKLTVVNKGSEQESTVQLSKDEFASAALQVIRRTISYQLERKNTRIKIYDDATAMVTYEMYETFKFRQGTLRASSRDEMYVSLRDGKLVITSIETRTRFY
jgi:hypothetical protein